MHGSSWCESRDGVSSQAEILAEAIDLMHPLVQDRYDSDVLVRQFSPIDEMPFVSEEVPLDTERNRDRFRHDPVSVDPVESLE